MSEPRKFIVHQQPSKGWKPLETLANDNSFYDGLYLARFKNDETFTCFVVKIEHKLYISSDNLESGRNHNKLGFCITDNQPEHIDLWQFNDDFCLDIWGER